MLDVILCSSGWHLLWCGLSRGLGSEVMLVMWFLVPRNDNCCGECAVVVVAVRFGSGFRVGGYARGVIPRSSEWQLLWWGLSRGLGSEVICVMWFLVPRNGNCCASARWLLWCALSRGLRSEVMLVMWFLVPRNDKCYANAWWLLWWGLGRGLRSEVMLVMCFLVPRNDNCCAGALLLPYR